MIKSCLRKDDYISSTYRDHVHALSKGVSARKVMAELFGKKTGTCRGQGGSMHMFDAEFGLVSALFLYEYICPSANGLICAFLSLFRVKFHFRKSKFAQKMAIFPLIFLHKKLFEARNQYSRLLFFKLYCSLVAMPLLVKVSPSALVPHSRSLTKNVSLMTTTLIKLPLISSVMVLVTSVNSTNLLIWQPFTSSHAFSL